MLTDGLIILLLCADEAMADEDSSEMVMMVSGSFLDAQNETVHFSGTAQDEGEGSIRCDSSSFPEFWLSLTPIV